ncbi:uncharacterized protein LY79DRAFT_674942 [Colletotrichum navitas]|uniref:Uncharacterized protein n=1 Tax=Colletotrichum navitas TaxID=681940 RepID=A0AAD8UYN4_9PEZI|nr:uncharacterized protein LY79DRAFT_674942 [Colletotrichum navitas]KAK1566106.1 hypothetical protein LY79DRAFT_674942 [Colletotrichum navitas]
MVNWVPFVAVPAVAVLGFVLRATWPMTQQLPKATVVETSKQLNEQICSIHHRVQAYTMSSEVQTLYEFIGVTNPSPSSSSAIIEQRLWTAWATYVNKNKARSSAAITEKDILVVAIIKLLLTDPQARAHYNEMVLDPLLQASDRPVSLRSICGRHWAALINNGHKR